MRFFVEKQHIPRHQLLTNRSYQTDYGENALHVAIANDHYDVVDYVLEDWARLPVGALQVLKDLELILLSLVFGHRVQIIVCAFAQFEWQSATL